MTILDPSLRGAEGESGKVRTLEGAQSGLLSLRCSIFMASANVDQSLGVEGRSGKRVAATECLDSSVKFSTDSLTRQSRQSSQAIERGVIDGTQGTSELLPRAEGAGLFTTECPRDRE